MILKYISKVLVGYKAHKTDVNRQKKKIIYVTLKPMKYSDKLRKCNLKYN